MKSLPTRPRLNVELTRFPADLYQNHRQGLSQNEAAPFMKKEKKDMPGLAQT